jgi:hypothetical protein
MKQKSGNGRWSVVRPGKGRKNGNTGYKGRREKRESTPRIEERIHRRFRTWIRLGYLWRALT